MRVVTLPGGQRATGVDEASAAPSNLLEGSVELREDGAPAHDFAPLHLMTTRSLTHMRRAAPQSDWDPRRFRPNLVLDDGNGMA